MSEEQKSTPTLHLIERRTEGRVLVHVPVEVTNVEEDGLPMTERTFIEDVSDFGCRLSTRGQVKQGDTVAVKILGRYGNNLMDEEPRLYEIMWVAPKGHGQTVGARVLQGERLANTRFPKEDKEQKRYRK